MRLQFRDGIKTVLNERFAVLFFLTALIFLHRPIMAAGFTDWAGITLFSEGLFVILAMGFLLLRWQTLRELLRKSGITIRIILAILLLSGLLHWICGGFYRPEYLGLSLFWCLIPMFAAVYRNQMERYLPPALGILWLCNAILCLIQETFSDAMLGITGNWNWSAILTLVTFPFALRCIPPFCAGRKFYVVLIWLITGILLIYLQSRAAYLSIAAAAAFWCFLKYKKIRLPVILCGGLLLAGAVVFGIMYQETLQQRLSGEIRMEIWKGTAELIKDHPQGVGVVTFENEFIPYKTLKYFMNPHCAIRTSHPHNELLYLAGTLGVPAMLAFLVWMILAAVGAIKEYDNGFMSRKRVLFLLALIALLVNGMLDITFHAWPVGFLLLLFFGLFAFPGERIRQQESSDSPARRIGLTVTGLAAVLALINLAGTFCWESSHEAVVKKDNVSAKKYAAAALILAPEIPHLIYRCATEMSMRDRMFSMELAERIQSSPWSNFAHIHGLKAQNYVLMRQDEKAIPEYLLDAKCYPLHILPYIGALTAYGRLGKTEMVPVMDRKIRELVMLRKLTPQQIRAIMQNPVYDMHPERIGQPKPQTTPWEWPF